MLIVTILNKYVDKLSFKEKEQLILHLIKSCENFDLNEKES